MSHEMYTGRSSSPITFKVNPSAIGFLYFLDLVFGWLPSLLLFVSEASAVFFPNIFPFCKQTLSLTEHHCWRESMVCLLFCPEKDSNVNTWVPPPGHAHPTQTLTHTFPPQKKHQQKEYPSTSWDLDCEFEFSFLVFLASLTLIINLWTVDWFYYWIPPAVSSVGRSQQSSVMIIIMFWFRLETRGYSQTARCQCVDESETETIDRGWCHALRHIIKEQ